MAVGRRGRGRGGRAAGWGSTAIGIARRGQRRRARWWSPAPRRRSRSWRGSWSRRGSQDQAAAGRPRLPLAADGADARRVRARWSRPLTIARAAIPWSPADRRAGDRRELADRVLGAARARDGAVRRRRRATLRGAGRAHLRRGRPGRRADRAGRSDVADAGEAVAAGAAPRTGAEAECAARRPGPGCTSRGGRSTGRAVLAGTRRAARGPADLRLPAASATGWTGRRPGGDVGRPGCRPAGHPLLGAAVELADGGGLVLTGRLSLDAQPWLADHARGWHGAAAGHRAAWSWRLRGRRARPAAAGSRSWP